MRWLVILAALVLLSSVTGIETLGLSGCADAAEAGAAGRSAALAERGKYLAVAGNCEGCHTAPGGQPFAGGNSVATPFGAIRSPNLTPDRPTGIGTWTDGDFIRAMRDGIRRGGEHLYPAFPYPWYSRVKRQDLLAIRAYLATLPPVRHAVKRTELPFPYERDKMLVWNALFLSTGPLQPVAEKSSLWNRGAYLVEGLGHCGACHTPKNSLGAGEASEAYRGGTLPDKQRVPGLRSEGRRGLGRWTADDIVQYLKTGQNRHKAASGQMAVVITTSTSNMADTDLKAIAIYLKDMPVQNVNAVSAGPH
jgi:mono/diheme cytochrome c family protein